MTNNSRSYHIAASTISIVGLLLIWEVVGRSGLVHKSLFPPPSMVLRAFLEMFESGEISRDAWVSSKRALLGLMCGTTIGVMVGMITGRNRLVDSILSPIIQLVRPLPPVALIPLILVWFGIGELSKIFSISFAVFFPVWINTHLGAQSVPQSFLWSAYTLGYGKLKIITSVVFPAALPYTIAGFRNGISIAFIMVFVSELAGASAGIGYQINISHLAYRVDRMMAALVVLGGAGAITDIVATRILWRIFPWLKFVTQK